MKSNAAHIAVYYEPSVYIPMIIMAVGAVICAIVMVVWSKWRDCNDDEDPNPCEKVKTNTKYAGISFGVFALLAMFAAMAAIKWKAVAATAKALGEGDLAAVHGASSHLL